MLDHIDFDQPAPPEFFVSRQGNLLYQPNCSDKRRHQVRGFGWRRRFAPWAGIEAVIIRYA